MLASTAFDLPRGARELSVEPAALRVSSRLSPPGPAVLALEDGTCFRGEAVGAAGETQGEIVFNTSLTGYQEVLTDPSYAGQIVTMTCPEIGNYGVTPEDREARVPQVAGLVVRQASVVASNWRSQATIQDYLIEHGIVAIAGVDTRALTRRLRSVGVMRAALAAGDVTEASLVARARQVPPMEGADLASGVTCASPFDWRGDDGGTEGEEGAGAEGVAAFRLPARQASRRLRVAAYDFGIKRNILRSLVDRRMEVMVVPASTPAGEVLKLKPNGVLLSNGPGDPEPVAYGVESIRDLIGKVPLFGICLGHQLIGLALGGKTYKLRFGHHGANHPVKNLETGAIEITSQNHGFAVDIDSLQGLARLTHLNLNDLTSEGLSVREKFLFAVQYHPESSPGPHDSHYLFCDFARMMDDFKGK